MAKNSFFCFLLIVFNGLNLIAQEHYYFIGFKDKKMTVGEKAPLSKKSIKRRLRQGIAIQSSDFPVSPAYIQEIVHEGLHVVYPSKWLNGVVVTSSKGLLFNGKGLPCVSHVQYLGSHDVLSVSKTGMAQVQKTETLDYGNALYQVQSLGVDRMHDAGFNGKGIYVAIFDGGFLNANTLPIFAPIYSDGRLKYTFNIVDNIPDVYVRHTHGTNVMSCLAAYSPGKLIGTGFGVDLALFITEDVNSEKLIEEYNWLRAAEMADSVGVDLISSSLGYNLFDNPSENHTLNQLDGKTAIITKAAEMAYQKGILVVNSAGNNYTDPNWRNIVFPADGEFVLAVGAVDNTGSKASFSAIGPTADGRIKPDVVAIGVGVIVNNDGSTFNGGSGTSYSAPLVSGLAAGLWSTDTTLRNSQVRDALVRSGSSFCIANYQVGYGMPNFEVAYDLVLGKQEIKCRPEIYPNPVVDIIHLKDNFSFDADTFYSIADINGKVLLEGSLGTTQSLKLKIDVSTLRPGVYFLKLSDRLFKIIKL